MIVFTANGRCAKIKADEPITTGSVGMPVSVVLSGDFDGLEATMVFACGDVSADVALMGQEVTVPPQVLEEAGRVLEIGVYGARADGTIVIPTVWAKAGMVHEGVLPSGVDPASPTPSWVAQVQQWAEDAHDTAEQLAQDVENWEAEIDTAIENARDATQDATQTAASIAQAESSRVTAEQARATAESSRAAAESARVTAEASRATAEQSRAAAESSRAEAEQARATAESARATAESARATAEQGRVTAEQARAAAETARASAESGRVTTEQGRAIAENARASAESARVTAESARASAETSRTTAETARSNAESARATEWATIKTEAQDTISAAEDATDAAESAASDATAAADEARAASAATWLSGNVLFGELSEGVVLTADDVYAAPPKGVEVYGKSTQDGTPTPDAPVEIKSVDDLTLNVCGKNLFNPSHLLEASDWTVSDGVYTGMSNALYNKYKLDSGGYPIGGLSGTAQSYVMSLDYTPSDATKNTYIQFKYDDGTIDTYAITMKAAGHYTGTSNPNKVLAGIGFLYSSAQSISLSNIQFELGTTATAYEPYVGQSVEIPLSDNVGRSLPDGTRDELTLSYVAPSTEHEGWGVFSKTLVQRAGTVDMGTLTWGMSANYFYAYISDKRGGLSSDIPNVLLCTDYQVEPVTVSSNNLHDGFVSEMYGGTNRGVILKNSNYTTAADLKASLSGAMLQYLLATPVTHDLGTVELPVNPAPDLTAWADGGSAQPTIQLEYERALNIVIPRIEAAISDLATS